MSKYILRRLIQAVPTFFGITAIAFLIMLAAPGDPVTLITFTPGNQDPERAATLRRQLGLDQPALLQYLYWLAGNDWALVDSDGDGENDSYGTRQGLLRGDLGDSIKQQRPVTDLIIERVPATLQLTLTALIVGYGIGIVFGVLAAVYHKSWVDLVIRIISVGGNAIPPFWLGLILILVFSVSLDVLPMSGMRDITSSGDHFDLGDRLAHMLMPVTVLSFGTIAFISRFVRTEMLEVLEQDYVRTARAKGLPLRTVWSRHAIRNALIPVATFLGQQLGTLLAGAVIIERVFSWPGMGRLVVDAVFQRDFPLVMGSVVFASIFFILGVLLSDILYVWIDPRIRLN